MAYHASHSASSAQTDTSLATAPGAGYQIVVDSVYVTTDTAQTVSFESGNSTLKWRQYCAANGGHIQSDKDLFRCADNAALTYTSSATGNVFVAVKYRIMRTTQI